MGLSIYPGGASWAYGGFRRFRERLAEAEGFDLNEMAGYGDDPCRDWDEIHSTLAPLLNHSDRDGYLGAWECEPMVMRLRRIIRDWDEDDYDRQQAKVLIKGMEHCVEHRCAMVFC
jgi:hypothetical protein